MSSCLVPTLFSILMFLATAPAVLAELADPKAGEEVAPVREQAQKNDYVEVTGRVVSVSRGRFYTLKDLSDEPIIVVIPDYLTREIGAPRKGELIRVRGTYDHKTLLEPGKAEETDPEKTWGIRVTSVDRNLEGHGRNPTPDQVQLPEADPDAARRPAPAARSNLVQSATPRAPEELKVALSNARKRAISSREALENADAAQARAEYQNLQGAEMEELISTQSAAQQEYSAALAEIPPLVEAARAAGVDPKLIEMYESGVTQPAH